jgi:hypothetical protein
MIYGTWYGGTNYTFPSMSDVEQFKSIKEAKNVLQSRRHNYDGKTPCVSNNCNITLYFYDPRKERDPYPDRILTFGPRGGIVEERT